MEEEMASVMEMMVMIFVGSYRSWQELKQWVVCFVNI